VVSRRDFSPTSPFFNDDYSRMFRRVLGQVLVLSAGSQPVAGWWDAIRAQGVKKNFFGKL
jgi:hypothetical protein